MPRAPEPDPPGIPELPPGLIGEASPRAGVAYRLLRLAWHVPAALLGFRVEVTGLESLPRDRRGPLTGGYIAAGLPHRSWVDPFLAWGWLPVEPRLVFFGDARTMARSPLRRWVMRRVGGILPIPSHGGPRSFATHLAAAADVLDAGAVFCLFPESGLPSPAGIARPISPGFAYMALRSGAPIAPIVLGGNDVLCLGRRLTLRIGAPVGWRELAAMDGAPVPDVAPEPGSGAERRLARRVSEGFHAFTADAVLRAHEDMVPPPGTRLRWTGLTHLFR
ncbi:MAG TPA: 1-acyl-sn-glycerol-3-phosphate acyltransferase [Candidatus Limnocylindrales bacterium]|nr:1-acyl-sn-glycerol-3-phosphate acyltransferase [Candidatus Limnocylindrales bacterium]